MKPRCAIIVLVALLMGFPAVAAKIANDSINPNPVVTVAPAAPPETLSVAGLVYPDERPSWCAEPANFCVSLADSAAHRTTYILMKRFPDEERYHFSYENGTHAVRISTPKSNRSPVTIDGNGSVLDCLNSVSKGADGLRPNTGTERQACIVSLAPDTTIRGFQIVAGEGLGPGSRTTWGSDGAFRCIAVHGNITVEDMHFIKCKHGVQGSGNFDWTFRRIKMEDCAVKDNGKTHCIYSGVGSGKLTIEDSDLQTYAGHVVKSGQAVTIIRNTTLTEGTGDSGYAVHSTSNGAVVLEDVNIHQPKILKGARDGVGGNVIILAVGPKANRCGGPGEWRLKNVTMTDVQPDLYPDEARVRFRCPLPTIAVDLGGNTLNGKPLFIDGVPR